VEILEALRVIENEDPEALLTKTMIWKIGDLIAAIEAGDSGFGFKWSLSGTDYSVERVNGTHHVRKATSNKFGDEKRIFSSPTPKQLGIIGGSMRSEAKKKAAVENGKKGGRPHYFLQLYNSINPAIQNTKTEFPVELLPPDSPMAFSIRCEDFVWLIRWDVLNRNVVAFHNGLVAQSYDTVSNLPATLAKMLVQEINRTKMQSMPEDFSKEKAWIEEVTGEPFDMNKILPDS